ncbi:hypothetical protein L218DRAFT_1004308 [Marasmius fiardii PR-910]|nr:hypothetical protein L218DRAFT_1004308 [Marasmius fiardii PR-910]
MADDESYLLIAQLHLQDLQEITERRNRKGKSKEGAPPTDEEYALQLQTECFSSFMADVVNRRTMSRITTDEHREHRWAENLARRPESSSRPSVPDYASNTVWRPPSKMSRGESPQGEQWRDPRFFYPRGALSSPSSNMEKVVTSKTSASETERHVFPSERKLEK